MKKQSFNPKDYFDELASEGMSNLIASGNIKVGIVEFAEEIIFNGESELYPTQRAILKAFYGEALTEDELFIIQEWKLEEKSRSTWVEGRTYKNLVIEAGRRGSKSTLISIIVLYEFYKLINLPSPSLHYGLLPNSPIAIFVIAQSQAQVKETLFAAITGYAEGSDYFQSLVKSKRIEILTEEIRCNEKNIGVYAKHTSSKSLVGYSLKVLVIDEAARFEYDELGNSKADLIWENIGAGVSTFGDEGFKIAISSAWEPQDCIEKLYELAEKDYGTLAFRLKTWQINLNPTLSESVLKASDAYIKNPVKAALEYEGVRARKQGTFFVEANVKAAFTGYSACDAHQIPLDITNKEGDTRTYTGIQITRLTKSFTQSFAHVDYGIKKDGAAFAVCSPIQIEERKWGISVDVLMLWKPYVDRDKDNKGIKRIVSFVNTEEIFYEVAKARRVIKFSFDQFQSQAAIQRLHLDGINTCLMSTATAEQSKYYTTTRKLIDHGLLILPKDSHCSISAELELSNIIELPNGKITHSVYAKDLSDAITNSVYNCYLYMVQNGTIIQNTAFTSSIAKVANSSYNNNSNLRSKLPSSKDNIVRLKRY